MGIAELKIETYSAYVGLLGQRAPGLQANRGGMSLLTLALWT
jgi:hypothetical protein